MFKESQLQEKGFDQEHSLNIKDGTAEKIRNLILECQEDESKS